MSIRSLMLLTLLSLPFPIAAQTTDLGNLSKNPYDPNSTSNPYGAGNPYDPNSINNPYGQYGNPYSNTSATNPYATNAPKLYDREGNYRGKLSSNPYDAESISNPYGRYGNPYSPDSINNPYGAGNPYDPNSPTNPYGDGWKIVGDDDDTNPSTSYPNSSFDYSEPKSDADWTDSLQRSRSLFKNYGLGGESDDSNWAPYDYDYGNTGTEE